MKKPVFELIRKFSCNYFEGDGSEGMSRPHYHDAYEIIFLAEGKRYINFNGMRLPMEAGDIFFAPPFVQHMTQGSDLERCRRYVANFSMEDFLPYFDEKEFTGVIKNLSVGIIHLDEKQSRNLVGLFEMLRYYDGSYGELEMKLELSQFFIILNFVSGVAAGQQPAGNSAGGGRADNRAVSEAVEYVKRNYMEDITLDMAAEYVHLSKSQFCRVFKLCTGTTFNRYLNCYRNTKAHILISGTDMSLHEIAARTGFSSTEHMTRTFESLFDMSPSDWRRKYGKS